MTENSLPNAVTAGSTQSVALRDNGTDGSEKKPRNRPTSDLNKKPAHRYNNGVDTNLDILDLRDGFERAFAAAKIGRWHWSVDEDCLMSCSPEFARLLAAPLETIHYLSENRFLDRVQLDDRSKVADERATAIATKTAYNISYRLIALDGTSRDVKEIGNPILAEAGQVIAFVGTLQDISEEKSVAQALTDARRHAETQAVRAARLSLDAERADKAKSEFFAAMTHDLRTPLNAIIGFADILFRSEKCDQKTRREFAAYIHESGQHLLLLVNQLLDMSKIEAGAMELDIETVNVSRLMARSATFVSGLVKEQGIDLQTTDAPDDLNVDVDKQAIIRVLINLLSNAAKFTEKGKRVFFDCQRGSNGDLKFIIRDEGAGMSAEDAARVLKPYVQAKAANNGVVRAQGTGLGLPISKQLVELHGGTLKLDSELDVGTTVTVTLPAVRVVKDV